MAIGDFRKLCAAGVFASFATALAGHSAMAGVVIATARIDQGLLLVTGTSPTGTTVKMDLFDPVPIDPVTRQFSISEVYVPADCIVDLEIAGSPIVRTSAVIANCAPANLIPRGTWDTAATYYLNDLVYFQGSTYRAINPGPLVNKGTPPGGTNWQNYWQLFVSKGANGIAGATGPAGPAGATGPAGEAGPAGATGPAGADGAAGPQGDRGLRGLQGDAGPQGDVGPQGPAGADGAVGPQGPAGSDGAVGPAGPQGPRGVKGDQGDAGPQGPIGLTGATGPQGVAGATGATGPQGPVGTGIGGHGIVSGVSATNSANKSVTISCGTTKVVLGGGAVMPVGFEGSLTIYSSYPSAANAWTVQVVENDSVGSNWSFTGYAVCATK